MSLVFFRRASRLQFPHFLQTANRKVKQLKSGISGRVWIPVRTKTHTEAPLCGSSTVLHHAVKPALVLGGTDGRRPPPPLTADSFGSHFTKRSCLVAVTVPTGGKNRLPELPQVNRTIKLLFSISLDEFEILRSGFRLHHVI